MNEASLQFLKDLDKNRVELGGVPKAAHWESAEPLFNRGSAADSRSAAETVEGNRRANLDAAAFGRAERDSQPKAAQRVDAEASSNHAVLGLIFLKYVSDSFAMRQREIEAQPRDPKSDYYLEEPDPKSGASAIAEYAKAIHQELEERDYHTEKNVLWAPTLARWKTLKDCAKLPPGTEIEVINGKKTVCKISSTGRLIDDALEKENPKLKGVLDKRYTQLHLEPAIRPPLF